MNREVIRRGNADEVLPLIDIADSLMDRLQVKQQVS
jgi:hypothetical protein